MKPGDSSVSETIAIAPVLSSGLGERAASGVVWFIVQNLGSRATAFLSQIALAWFLSPTDFGLIGLTYVVTNIASTLVSFGIDDVMVRRQRMARYWAGSLLTVGIALGSLVGLSIAVVAPLCAHLYGEPKIAGLLWVMALSMPIGTLSTPPTVILRADLRFRLLASYGAAELMCQQALTITLAWAGIGAYAFVLPIPLMAAVRAITLWSTVKRPRRLTLQAAQVRHLLKHGLEVFVSKLVVSTVSQGDYAILGMFASSAKVGAYFFAFRLAAQPVFVLAGNFASVIRPVLGRFRNDENRQCQAALRASRLLAHIVIPLGFIQAVVARPLLQALFGARWADAIPLIMILSVGLTFDAPAWVAGAFMNARGEFRRNLSYQLIAAPIFFALVILGAFKGSALGVAVAVAIYYTAYGPIYTYAAFREDRVAPMEVLKIYCKPAALAAVAIMTGSLVGATMAHEMNNLELAGVIASVASTVYVLLVRTFSPDIYLEVEGRIRSRLQPLWARAGRAFTRSRYRRG